MNVVLIVTDVSNGEALADGKVAIQKGKGDPPAVDVEV